MFGFEDELQEKLENLQRDYDNIYNENIKLKKENEELKDLLIILQRQYRENIMKGMGNV